MIDIFVPFTKIGEATRIALIGYDYRPVDVSGDDFAYGRHFAARWAQRQDFVNVEHDCIPWPGAIEAIASCPEPWCTYDYSLPCLRERDMHHPTTMVPLGCAKIGADLMIATIDIWKAPCHWENCDRRITEEARALGLEVHQHFPGIVNANSALDQLGSPWTVNEVVPVEEIAALNLRRIEQLNAQGFPMIGIDVHYLVELLEGTLAPDAITRARYRQEAWLASELDRVESAIRRGTLTAPLSQQGARR